MQLGSSPGSQRFGDTPREPFPPGVQKEPCWISTQLLAASCRHTRDLELPGTPSEQVSSCWMH